MSLLNSFDTDANIWEVEPQLKIPKVFAELYKNDKSKGKAHSSKIMWAIALLVDNSEANKFRNLREDDRKSLISTDFLKDELFDFDEYQEAIDSYIELNMSKLEKELRQQELKLEERAKFINDTPYNIENGDKLDKFLINTGKLYDQIKELKDKIKSDTDGGNTKGGMVESASERGLI
jgi:hypothetical protein